MKKTPEFVVDADNVYRTKKFIVKQCVAIQYETEENTIMLSHDIYYKRTRSRDLDYEDIFKSRKHINGKRLPTTMYSRIYVE